MLQLKYLAHSSFLVECGNTKLIFDPWLKGPAYAKQWHLWPLPPEDAVQIKADAILLSHGHEDHLHAETLKEMDKSARIFFPFQWRAGIRLYLKNMGFNEITETISFRTYKVNDVKITYVGYSLESVVIIEYKNEVLVNINDALNSNHENAVDFILAKLKKKWPTIDYLLSGWSGAGYFPNQVKYPGKDDEEIGKLREQYFANNFFRFTNYLQPKWAVPFAPGFVLLEENNKWINHIKFPRKIAQQYYKEHFKETSATKFLIPFPADIIKDGILTEYSSLHAIDEKDNYNIAYNYYKKEIQEASKIEYATEKDMEELLSRLKIWMNFNKMLYHPKVIEDVAFSIKLNDVHTDTYLNIHWQPAGFSISRSAEPMQGRRLLLHMSALKMLYALGKTWGGDVLTIGYGLTVEVYDQLTLEKNLDIVCIRLITRYPMARKDMAKYPLRALKFYTHNPMLTSLWLRQKIKLKPYVNRYPFNERNHWLIYKKCDLCAVCKMPEINMAAY